MAAGPMSYKLAIATIKGGVGKTTIVHNLAGAFAEGGRKVLVVDLDQQGNLSSAFLNDIYSLPTTLYDILIDPDRPTRAAIQSTGFPNIDILPANLDLSRIEFQLAGDPEAQYYLADKLREVNHYDIILLDPPPHPGLMTLSALVAADGVVIPVECQEWAARGTTYVLEMIRRVRRRANPRLRLLGYVINKYDGRRKLEQTYREVLLERYGADVFQTIIRNSVKYPESASVRRPLTSYHPSSVQADTFRQLAREITQRAFHRRQRAARSGSNRG
ncbi:MAG: ParA family protein [Acidobacteria bacterium]|nr:MAG: ParA family protein [Acidobacteriota bacterium]